MDFGTATHKITALELSKATDPPGEGCGGFTPGGGPNAAERGCEGEPGLREKSGRSPLVMPGTGAPGRAVASSNSSERLAAASNRAQREAGTSGGERALPGAGRRYGERAGPLSTLSSRPHHSHGTRRCLLGAGFPDIWGLFYF